MSKIFRAIAHLKLIESSMQNMIDFVMNCISNVCYFERKTISKPTMFAIAKQLICWKIYFLQISTNANQSTAVTMEHAWTVSIRTPVTVTLASPETTVRQVRNFICQFLFQPDVTLLLWIMTRYVLRQRKFHIICRYNNFPIWTFFPLIFYSFYNHQFKTWIVY